MSCNGCRVLRKGCSDRCPLRPCLHWIPSPQSQAYATLFLAKFFGRSDLISFISSAPLNNRPALFQSLLFEACGRTINPVNGAVGLLCSGNWHVCQSAVETVLSGGVLRPLPEFTTPILDESSSHTVYSQLVPLPMRLEDPSPIPESRFNNARSESVKRHGGDSNPPPVSLVTGGSEMTSYGICGRNEKKKLLNLFV